MINLNRWLWAASPGTLTGETADDVIEAAREAFDANANRREFEAALDRLGYRPWATPAGTYELRLPEMRR